MESHFWLRLAAAMNLLSQHSEHRRNPWLRQFLLWEDYAHYSRWFTVRLPPLHQTNMHYITQQVLQSHPIVFPARLCWKLSPAYLLSFTCLYFIVYLYTNNRSSLADIMTSVFIKWLKCTILQLTNSSVYIVSHFGWSKRRQMLLSLKNIYIRILSVSGQCTNPNFTHTFTNKTHTQLSSRSNRAANFDC